MAFTINTKDSRGEPLEITIGMSADDLAAFAASNPQQQRLAAAICGQVSLALVPRWQREAMIATSDTIEALLAINAANSK